MTTEKVTRKSLKSKNHKCSQESVVAESPGSQSWDEEKCLRWEGLVKRVRFKTGVKESESESGR